MQSQSAEGQDQIQFVSPYPSMGQRDQCQSQGAAQAPSTSQMGHIGLDQSVGQGRPQNLRPRVWVRLGRGCATIVASLGI